MKRQFLEDFEEEEVPVLVAISDDQVKCQHYDYYHNCQLLLRGKVNLLGWPFDIVANKDQGVLHVLYDEFWHLFNRFGSSYLIELLVHDLSHSE